MKNRSFHSVLVILLLLSCGNDDTPLDPRNAIDITFLETLGGSKNDSGQSVVATPDGGYAILGFTQSMDGDVANASDESFDYWILKYDAQNTMQWQHTYGGSGDDRGRSIITTADGGYAVLGYTTSTDGDVTGTSGMQDFWLAKLDAIGNLQWQKSFGFSGNDYGIALIQTQDLGYAITGVLDVTASGGEGNASLTASRHAGGDYWVVRLNANGDLQWSRYFGGNFTDTPEGIVETADNGFIIAGGSDSEDTDISANIGAYDFWVIRISPTGALVWEKSFGGDQIDEARAIVTSDDGNYIIAGDTRSNDNDVSNNNGAADVWLIKITPEGDLLWEKTFGGSDFDVARALVKTQDNGYLLAGSSRSSDGDVSENKGQNDAWAIKVDRYGNLEWETSLGGSNIDFAYGIAELSDGTAVVVGDTASDDGDISINKGFTDALVFRIE